MLAHGHLLDCPLMVDDVCHAAVIYGPDVTFLKGHSVDCIEDSHVPAAFCSPVPSDILAPPFYFLFSMLFLVT